MPTSPARVPVIELSTDKTSSQTGTLDRNIEAVAQDVQTALSQSGFFYVRGHAVKRTTMDNLMSTTRNFFAQNQASKRKVSIDQHNRGYLGFGEARMRGAKRDDLKEVFFFGRELAVDDPDLVAGRPLCAANRWPDQPAEFRQHVLNYLDEVRRLGDHLLQAIALSFGADKNFFKSFYQRPMARGQLIHYPPTPQAGNAHNPNDNDDEQFGVAAHTDFGCITLLHQGTPGLEVRTLEGNWVEVPPVKDALVVNVGDLLERWSAGRAPSTCHRVRNTTGASRYSVAIFYDPSPMAIVSPADLVGSVNNSNDFPAVAAAEYILQRSRGVFAQFK